ncbi:MAG: DUF4836 family protein [Bacteroidia bacterium]|jgi:hypothetical protein|nr:DUF4836 family protein [Bacteroidia bacterium]
MNKGLKIGLIAGGSVMLLGAAALFIWLKFGKTDAHLRLIPKEATTVAIINVRNLFTKADPKKLMLLPVFQKSMNTGSMSPEMKKLMQDPTDLGADITQNIAGFINQRDGVTTSGLVFKINDGGRFASAISKIGGYTRPNKVDGTWYIPIESYVGLCWNDEAGVLFIGNALIDESNQQQAERLLHQPEEYSILDNPNYKAFAAQDFDIGLMVDNNVVQRNAGDNSWMDMYNMFGSPTGWSDVLINFEESTVDIRSTVHQGDVQTSVLRSSGPEANHLQALADKNPIGFLSAALDLKALLTQLRADANMKRNLESIEDELGMPMEDLLRSFSGDMSLALTDYRNIMDEDPLLKAKMEAMRKTYLEFNSRFDGFESDEEFEYPSVLEVPVFVLNLGIKDTVIPSKLVREEFRMQRTDEGFYSGASGMGANVYVAMKGSHMIVTNSYGTAAELMRNGKLQGKPAADVDVKGPLTGRFELTPEKMPVSFTEMLKKDMGNASYMRMTRISKPLQYISLSGEGNTNVLKLHVAPGDGGNTLYRLLVHAAEVANTL